MMKPRLSLFIGLLLLGLFSTASWAAVPGQFIGKMYTEALGRAPDPSGWQGFVNYFQQNGCSQPTLRQVGETFFLSPEYANLGYDNVEKVLTAYRAIFSREPDAGGFT